MIPQDKAETNLLNKAQLETYGSNNGLINSCSFVVYNKSTQELLALKNPYYNVNNVSLVSNECYVIDSVGNLSTKDNLTITNNANIVCYKTPSYNVLYLLDNQLRFRILKVKGNYIHDPSKLEYQRYDLDSESGSGRNQQGLMFRDRVAIKRKLVCTFPPMTDNEIKVLFQAVQDEFFELEFPDPYTGKRETMTCYVGDRTAPMYTYDWNKGQYMWQNLNMNFIER